MEKNDKQKINPADRALFDGVEDSFAVSQLTDEGLAAELLDRVWTKFSIVTHESNLIDEAMSRLRKLCPHCCAPAPCECGHLRAEDKGSCFEKRQYKMLVRHIKPAVPGDWEEKVERADGRALCSVCELEFREHPEVDGESGVVVDCSGRFWKL